MKITEFFSEDFTSYASYDNLRKICSVVDGQKNGSRKVLHTVLEKNIKNKIKVSQLGSKVAEFAEYLHGNLDGVIVNLAQDYAGSNNMPLLQKSGNFGTRFTPEASASRYIYTYGSENFFKLFSKDDIPVLKHQTFEGHKIEPMFYVPTLPILLINGSGKNTSSGFAQHILPRNIETIKKYIKCTLNGRKLPDLPPFFEGFSGTIEQGSNDAQWRIKGVIERIAINKVKITEIPINYNLKSYIKVLDTLEDNKIVQSYRDKSENDKFTFEVTIPSKELKSLSDEEILEKLKLILTITENYTVMDENNKIKTHNSINDVIDHYIVVKLEYMEKRRLHLIQKYTDDAKLNYSKYLFIQNIVDGTLIINKRKKADIIQDLEKIKNIIPKDGSFDYLLQMPILSCTEERLDKLRTEINNLYNEVKRLKNEKPENMWKEEL